jgi:GNAT superfamily N-acetyltransferase
MKEDIKVMKFIESWISEEEYYKSIVDLTLKSQEEDPTIVLHSKNEIIDRAKESIIVICNWEIVGNESIYKTQMKPLDQLYIDGKNIIVWEAWSLVVKKDFRKNWIWEDLIRASLNNCFDAVCFGTVNNTVIQLAKKIGYTEIPFPKEFYEEWKKHLSWKMKWWEEEFNNKAKCMMHFKDLDLKYREYIIETLLKQQE